MNKNILNTGVQRFISENLNTDILSILLKKPLFENISNKELAEQIASKRKCKNKLPTWFNTHLIYYPKKLNIEQTSSEPAARYKSEIVSGKTLFDLTGGFGVDSYFFSHKIDSVFHAEIDSNLAEIAAYNLKILDAEKVRLIKGDSINYLKTSSRFYDWLFLDPSRRNNIKGKVYHLSDCTPNILANLDLFFSRAQNVLLKTSPFLDISAGIKVLRNVKSIHIVAVNNEVKELLWVLNKDYRENIEIKTANLRKGHSETFNFLLSEEKEATSTFHMPQKYLYEPNAAILKSGAFKSIGQRYSLHKLHKDTHLFTADLLLDFPGRRFLIHKCLTYTKKNTVHIEGIKANISTRNFSITTDQIKKKHHIKDGGDTYLFFTKNLKQEAIVLICEKAF